MNVTVIGTGYVGLVAGACLADHSGGIPTLASPVIFDGRNLYDPAVVKAQGLEYYPIGRRT